MSSKTTHMDLKCSKGLTPTPPALSEAARRFTTRELFWITKHEIKLAGMPAFGATHSDDEIWGIVGFLQELEGMTPEQYAQRESRFGPGPAPHPNSRVRLRAIPTDPGAGRDASEPTRI